MWSPGSWLILGINSVRRVSLLAEVWWLIKDLSNIYYVFFLKKQKVGDLQNLNFLVDRKTQGKRLKSILYEKNDGIECTWHIYPCYVYEDVLCPCFFCKPSICPCNLSLYSSFQGSSNSVTALIFLNVNLGFLALEMVTLFHFALSFYHFLLKVLLTIKLISKCSSSSTYFFRTIEMLHGTLLFAIYFIYCSTFFIVISFWAYMMVNWIWLFTL